MKWKNTIPVVGVVVVAVSLVMINAAPTHSQDKEYVGVNNCKMCHNKTAEGAQYKQWTETKHSQAFDVLKTDRAVEVAKANGVDKPPHEAAQCLKCHVTSYDVETEKTHAKISMETGISCETCHGPGSEHVAAAKKFQFSKDAAAPPPSNVRPNQELCVTCHNTDSPTWNPERYTMADGTKTGFDFEQAFALIDHPNPKKSE